MLVVRPDYTVYGALLVHVRAGHLQEINDTGSEHNVTDTVPGSAVLALVENLEAVLDDNALVAVELVPYFFIVFVGPCPVQLV